MVGVRRRDLRRAIVAEYVALLDIAVVGGALAAIASLLLVLPSIDIGELGDFDPAVDYSPSLADAGRRRSASVLIVVLRHRPLDRATAPSSQGTPATLRQADAR